MSVLSSFEEVDRLAFKGDFHGYGRRPVPHVLDDPITTFVRNFGEASAVDRELVLANVCQTHSDILLAYAERMASLAVRVREAKILEDSALALSISIAAPKGDAREYLLIMPLLLRSAELLQRDWFEVFATGSAISDKVAEAVRAFLGRSPEDRSLEAMGYTEASDGDGFVYKRLW